MAPARRARCEITDVREEILSKVKSAKVPRRR